MENRQIIQQIAKTCENLPTKMKQAKEEQHKTNQQIIDSTGVCESAVKKFFSGHLTGPSIYDVTAIAIDLDLSLDELMELSPPKQDQSAEIEQLKSEIAHKDEIITEKDKEISAVRENWKRVTYGATGLAVLFGVFLMIYVSLDMRNPSLGLFQSGHTAPIVYVAAFSIVGAVLFVGHTMVKRRIERKRKHADYTR